MALSLHHIVIDAYDLPGLARFWSQVLDWPVLSEREREVVIGPSANAPTGICFMPSPDAKATKNRVHLDLAPDDQNAEVERLLALGARRVDIGQDDSVDWVVMADPEGNEFCVIRPKASLIEYAEPRA